MALTSEETQTTPSSNGKTMARTPTIEEQTFEAFRTDKNHTVPADFVIEFFTGIVIDNLWGPSFVQTQILADPNHTILQLKPILFEKFTSVQHRIIVASHSPSETNKNLNNIQYFQSTADLRSQPKSNLIYFDKPQNLCEYEEYLTETGFLVCIVEKTEPAFRFPSYFEIISEKSTHQQKLVLLRKCLPAPIEIGDVISLDREDFSWVKNLKKTLKSEIEGRLILVATNPISGIRGFMKCFLKEDRNSIINIQSLHLDSSQECEYEIGKISENKTIINQLKKNLIFNVYKDGAWGCFSNFSMSLTELQLNSSLNSSLKITVDSNDASENKEKTDVDDAEISTGIVFDPNKTYIIINGLGYMSTFLDWITDRGAKIMYHIKNSFGKPIPESQKLVNKWRYLDSEIYLRCIDLSSLDEITKVIYEADKTAPIGGIFNITALVEGDKSFEMQDAKSFKELCTAQVTVTEEINKITQNYFPHVEHFVVFSSQVGVRGEANQSLMGYACAAVDRICEERKRKGFNALAVQWGPMKEEHRDGNRYPGYGDLNGMDAQLISSSFEILDLLLQQDKVVVVGSFVSSRKIRNVKNTAEISVVETPATNAVNAVATILGIDNPSEVDESATLLDLGLDSLMIPEIKRILEEMRNFVLPTAKAYRELTFRELIALDKKADKV